MNGMSTSTMAYSSLPTVAGGASNGDSFGNLVGGSVLPLILTHVPHMILSTEPDALWCEFPAYIPLTSNRPSPWIPGPMASVTTRQPTIARSSLFSCPGTRRRHCRWLWMSVPQAGE